MTASSPTSDYALGSTDAEHDRLIRQAARLAPLTERLFREAGIGPGQRVLDLGSGVGDVAMLVAGLVGHSGEVVGIERDRRSLDRARARGAQKRWGGMDRVSLTDALVKANEEIAMLPALDEALSKLELIDPDQARLVELRYFVGLTNEETADALRISVATVKRRWALARAWLLRELGAA